MEFYGKRILVIGAGLSGIAAARLLDNIAQVVLYDANEKQKAADILAKIELPQKNFSGRIVLGELPQEMEDGCDFVVLSPGVPADLPLVNRLREKGAIVLGEVELAYQFSKGKIVAVTGTNGKTTTTALTGEIMRAYYNDVFVVGNIGIPYTEIVENLTKESVAVAEVSSFQLETTIDFHPQVSAILNITPDHLDRHHTMENYITAKLDIAKNQTDKDTCILNYEDSVLQEAAKKISARIVWFSSERKLSDGLYLEGDKIIFADHGILKTVCNIHELNIIGRHNYENVMAAVAAGLAMEIPMESIRKALKSFVAVEHRIEYVAEKRGVKYYNDSKGTNPDAAIKAIRAMTTKTLLIAGGDDKGSEYEDWIDAFEGKVRYLVLMGQTREKIAATAKKKGFHNIVMVDSIKEAVEFCAEHAHPGETVLLSPCCASWGMFQNYEERGRIFKELVHGLLD